jgi:hypothetical protein
MPNFGIDTTPQKGQKNGKLDSLEDESIPPQSSSQRNFKSRRTAVPPSGAPKPPASNA